MLSFQIETLLSLKLNLNLKINYVNFEFCSNLMDKNTVVMIITIY